MSIEPKRMKSDQINKNWANTLQYVRQGGTVIVEHYSNPIADIIPHDETIVVVKTTDAGQANRLRHLITEHRAVGIPFPNNSGDSLRVVDPFDEPVNSHSVPSVQVELIDTGTSEPIWFANCPADNCAHGEITLTEWRDDDGSVVLAGLCGSCVQEFVQCPDCEALTVFFDGTETPCETGCGAVFQKELGRKGETAGFRRIR